MRRRKGTVLIGRGPRHEEHRPASILALCARDTRARRQPGAPKIDPFEIPTLFLDPSRPIPVESPQGIEGTGRSYTRIERQRGEKRD